MFCTYNFYFKIEDYNNIEFKDNEDDCPVDKIDSNFCLDFSNYFNILVYSFLIYFKYGSFYYFYNYV
jgi:hypothetical protein